MPEPTAQASVVIDADRDQVWHALTDPELIPKYFMGATVRTDWKVGHPVTFAGTWKNRPYEDKGEILAFEPLQELCYSHWSPLSGTDDVPDNYHVVDIRLSDRSGGTQVTLTQTNLTGDATEDDRAHRDEYESNWASMLHGLKEVAEAS